MKLWHISLIPALPDKILQALHRDCCAIRGGGWRRASQMASIVYVTMYPLQYLLSYHLKVIREMEARNWSPNEDWEHPEYRGLQTPPMAEGWIENPKKSLVFEEHNLEMFTIQMKFFVKQYLAPDNSKMTKTDKERFMKLLPKYTP